MRVTFPCHIFRMLMFFVANAIFAGSGVVLDSIDS